MKIYTRTGDDGTTGLLGGIRVAKESKRIEAYGTVDELNATIGLAASATDQADLQAVLFRVQKELFTLGAELATPPGSSASARSGAIQATHVTALEAEIDRWEIELEPLRNFILPGGTDVAARLHLARTVCRRAERRCLELSRVEAVAMTAIHYLNRLSDHLFVAARVANRRAGCPDVPWRPDPSE